jgi:multiple sugar transport system substrate-binding protein
MGRSRWISFLAAAALALGACAGTATSPAASEPVTPSGAAPSSDAASPSSDAASPAAPSGEAITLTLVEHQDLRIAALKEVLPDFEAAMAAAGKNVKVELVETVMSDQEFQTKLGLDYSSENAADVMEYPAPWTVDFAAAGYLLDLTDRLPAWPDWEGNFYPVIRDAATDDAGKNFYVPGGASLMQLFYRDDVLAANDVATDQPMSWQDLIDRMKDLGAKLQKPPILFPAGTSWGGGTFDEGFIHVFQGTGGQLYNDDTGKWIVKSQALTDSLKFYEELVANNLLPVDALLNPEPWQPTKYIAFPAGDLAVTTQGSWGWRYDWGPEGATPIEGLFDKVKTWAFPTQDGSSTFVSAAQGWAWTINAKTAHPDEAFELVKFLTTGEAHATLISAVGDLAARDDVDDVAPYSEQTVLVESGKLLTTGKFFKAHTGIDKIQQGIGQATEAILTKEKTADEAAADFTANMTELLGADKVEEQ